MLKSMVPKPSKKNRYNIKKSKEESKQFDMDETFEIALEDLLKEITEIQSPETTGDTQS